MELLLLLCLFTYSTAQWTASNYPNPVKSFRRCGLRKPGRICDPDGLLSPDARIRLDNLLTQMQEQTREPNATTPCNRAGTPMGIALMRQMKSRYLDDVKSMANDLVNDWDLDDKCRKSMVALVSIDDNTYWVGTDENAPIFVGQIKSMFNSQHNEFETGAYENALTNIIDMTREIVRGNYIPVYPSKSGPEKVGRYEYYVVVGVIAFAILIMACMGAVMCNMNCGSNNNATKRENSSLDSYPTIGSKNEPKPSICV